MTVKEIPVIDLTPYFEGSAAGKRAVARAVDEACRNIGFLVISGHGVDETLIRSIREVSNDYFNLPTEEKLELRMPPDRYRGYTPIGTEGLAASLDNIAPPDLKESFSIGPVNVTDDSYHTGPQAGSFFANNNWPTAPHGMREIWEAYYRAMEELAGSLMRIFALALDLQEGWFDDKIDKHITNFSVIHYPEPTGEPIPGQLRAGAHTDYGSLTILQKDDAAGGLQVQDHDGSWIDVPAIPGSFVVNLGDLMAEWTNDRWRSTMHRVVMPEENRRNSSNRYAMAFFHQPNYDAVVECIPTCCDDGNPARYGKTTSGEHVLMKIMKHRAPDQA